MSISAKVSDLCPIFNDEYIKGRQVADLYFDLGDDDDQYGDMLRFGVDAYEKTGSVFTMFPYYIDGEDGEPGQYGLDIYLREPEVAGEAVSIEFINKARRLVFEDFLKSNFNLTSDINVEVSDLEIKICMPGEAVCLGSRSCGTTIDR